MDPVAASRKISMPTQDVQRHDEYRCMFHRFDEDMAINNVVPRPSNLGRVHHMTLYACEDKFSVNADVDEEADVDAQTQVFSCESMDSLIDQKCTVAMGYDGMMMVMAKKLHQNRR